jgi:hypothetical protein
MSLSPQVVDVAVTKTKFEREVDEFRQLSRQYAQRGWFLADVTFPEVLVVMAAPQLQPPAIVTGVLFDFTDYDVLPPSVRLVNAFTRDPYTAEELPTTLMRQTEAANLPPGFQLPPGMPTPKVIQQQPLMQAYGPTDVPFLCIAGVREYHDHPAHSGDRWELHRRGGAGRLGRILEVIDTYGVRPINGYGVNLVPTVAGFTQAEVPA